MSGFVATAPAIPAPGANIVLNDGWFPNFTLTEIRDTVRLDGTVTDARLRDAARYAINIVNRQLSPLRLTALAVAADSLGALDAAMIDGQNRLEMLYRRAVICTLKADIIERYRDYDSTDAGFRRAEELASSIDEQRRNANWAIRDMLGQPHTVVELI